jgi:fatty-acyl-CoA synthase
MIVSGGFNIFPREVEDVLSQHADVAMVAVVGVPDDKWGERPVAFVVVKEGAAPQCTEDVVRKHVAQFADKGTVSKYAVPDRVYFVDAIPKTSVGKLDKKVIRAKLADTKRAGAAAGAR